MLNKKLSFLTAAKTPFKIERLSSIEREVGAWKRVVKNEELEGIASRLGFKIFQAILAHKMAWGVKDAIAKMKERGDTFGKLLDEIFNERLLID